jgi:hypothetical protein
MQHHNWQRVLLLPVPDDFGSLQSWTLDAETAVRKRQDQRVQEGKGSLTNLVDL